MFCGTRSFSHVDDGSWAPSPRPKRSKLKKSLSALDSKANTNPYSANGLDKFERLLAELEARKKKVLALKNGSSEDTVRFRYAHTDDWIPIVIKRPPPPPPKKEEKKKEAAAAAAAEVKKLEVADEVASTAKDHGKVVVVSSKRRRRRKMRWEWSVPSWAVVMVVVLMCLLFGRAFAVCWATILWYVAPMMKCGESSDNLRKEKKKKKTKKKYGERLGSNLSGFTSMEVKKMGDGSAGSGITT